MLRKLSLVTLLLVFILLLAGPKHSALNTPDAASDTITAGTYVLKGKAFSREGRFDSSIAYYLKASSLYRDLGYQCKSIACLIKTCDIYISLGDINSAWPYINQSVALSKEHNCNQELGGSYNGLGACYAMTGQIDSAIQYFHKALSIWLPIGGEAQPGVAEAYANMSYLHNLAGNFEEAIKLTDHAIQSLQKQNTPDTLTLMYLYSNLAAFHYQKGDFVKTIELSKQALTNGEKAIQGAHPLLGAIYNNIGDSYRNLGDNHKALIYLQKASSILMVTGGPASIQYATTLNNIGAAQSLTGNYTAALSNLRKAYNIFLSNPGQEESQATTITVIANLYETLNKYDSAELLLKNAIARLTGSNPDNPLLSILYTNLGNLYANKGHYKSAALNHQTAIKIANEKYGRKHPITSIAYHNLADLMFQQSELSRSLRFFQYALAANCKGFDDTLTFENPNPEHALSKLYLLRTLIYKSTVQYILFTKHTENLDQLKAAYKTIDLAIDLIQNLRAGFRSEDAVIMMDNDVLSAYSAGILFAHTLYTITADPAYAEQAFAYSEKSRSAILFSSLKDLEAKKAGGIPANLLDMERTYRHDLSYYSKAVQEEQMKAQPDPKKITLWQDIQFQRKNSYDSLIQQFESNYPEYYNLKYNLGIANTGAIQKSLNPQEVLIEFAFADSLLFTFVISADKYHIVKQRIDTGFINELDSFRTLLLKKDITPGGIAEYAKSAGKIYKTLFHGLQPDLRNKKLIIVPDAELGGIPFEALIQDTGHTYASYKNLPYLIKNNSICYGYSATIYFQSLSRKKELPSGKILAFSPSFNNNNQLLIASMKERGMSLSDLEGAREEARLIEEKLGGTVFLDTTATKANFIQYAPQYGILHISTHGILEKDRPMESKLAFYCRNEDEEKGFLHLYELYSLRLNAELAVLSACNSGYGMNHDGEGIMSLSRGFMHAGVPSIVSTLWNVNDQSTALIMKSFYENLLTGDFKSVAMQKAQLGFLENADPITAHPYYWAGFLTVGNNHPVEFSSNHWILWPVLFLLLVIATILIYKKYFIKNRTVWSKDINQNQILT